MPIFWFLSGVLATLAALALLSRWLKTLPIVAAFTATPLRAVASAAAMVAAIFGLYDVLGHWPSARPTFASSASSAITSRESTATDFAAAARSFDTGAGASVPLGHAESSVPPNAATNAGSMDAAIANLQNRLAKGGGSAGDWELAAKSFEFLGRPNDAAKARAHQLAPGGAANDPAAPPASSSIGGSITLDPALGAKAAVGDTLFIVAKSVDSPGIPVAVIRTRVEVWPVRFTLDDSQAMMPGRTLSTAGRVTIDARISKKGQPMPASGDLQGSSGVIDPTARPRPVQIKVDRVIP